MRTQFNDDHKSQAQALYSSLSYGAGGALGALMGGLLWDQHPKETFLIASCAVAVGFAICYFGLHLRESTLPVQQLSQE